MAPNKLIAQIQQLENQFMRVSGEYRDLFTKVEEQISAYQLDVNKITGKEHRFTNMQDDIYINEYGIARKIAAPGSLENTGQFACENPTDMFDHSCQGLSNFYGVSHSMTPDIIPETTYVLGDNLGQAVAKCDGPGQGIVAQGDCEGALGGGGYVKGSWDWLPAGCISDNGIRTHYNTTTAPTGKIASNWGTVCSSTPATIQGVNDTKICPAACSTCLPGGGDDGQALVGGVCHASCSSQGYCGTGNAYTNGGTNCAGCPAPTQTNIDQDHIPTFARTFWKREKCTTQADTGAQDFEKHKRTDVIIQNATSLEFGQDMKDGELCRVAGKNIKNKDTNKTAWVNIKGEKSIYPDHPQPGSKESLPSCSDIPTYIVTQEQWDNIPDSSQKTMSEHSICNNIGIVEADYIKLIKLNTRLTHLSNTISQKLSDIVTADEIMENTIREKKSQIRNVLKNLKIERKNFDKNQRLVKTMQYQSEDSHINYVSNKYHMMAWGLLVVGVTGFTIHQLVTKKS